MFYNHNIHAYSVLLKYKITAFNIVRTSIAKTDFSNYLSHHIY